MPCLDFSQDYDWHREVIIDVTQCNVSDDLVIKINNEEPEIVLHRDQTLVLLNELANVWEYKLVDLGQTPDDIKMARESVAILKTLLQSQINKIEKGLKTVKLNTKSNQDKLKAFQDAMYWLSMQLPQTTSTDEYL